MSPPDIVIRGGTVIDGTGAPARRADVAITGSLITRVGTVDAETVGRTIDATGLHVTPGFVDIHAHYDGQATWDERMIPSSWHGVTTVVAGNCGVGFAPVHEHDHGRLIELMEGVEDIPGVALHEGLKWNWTSFPDFLDAIDRRPFDVDVATQLPHAALRLHVMGERGADREPATPAEIGRMGELAAEAVEAGALGFSTSRTLNHRTSDGQPTPTLTAAEDELTGIAQGLGAAGRGVLQVVSDFTDADSEFAMLRRIVASSGRPLSFSLVQSPVMPDQWQRLLALLSEATADGLPMKAQVCGRPVGILLGLELTLNPFSQHRSYRAISRQPHAERVAQLRNPEFRAQLLSEATMASRGVAGIAARGWHLLYLLEDGFDYEPPAERSVKALAAARGCTPEELALDHMLSREGRGMLYLPFLNYAGGNLDPSHAMLSHPETVPGLSDGGAHVGMICDGSFPTSNLTHWTRERTRGPRLPLGRVVRSQTWDTARAVQLLDRGLIAPGYRADLNVIDYDRLSLCPPEVAYDLPAGGRRLVQRARGYVATIVAGAITYREGEATGALPGRLIRGAQTAPATSTRAPSASAAE
jgi:N-acyl-D-aspartate/D-glutamate deacylase